MKQFKLSSQGYSLPSLRDKEEALELGGQITSKQTKIKIKVAPKAVSKPKKVTNTNKKKK